jgi:adenosylcobinamide-phosphate synthase
MLLASLPALSAGLVIDRVVGDPDWLWKRVPHPVAIAGRAIDWFDRRFNDPRMSFARRRRRGALAVAFLAVAASALGFGLHSAFRAIPFGMAPEALIIAVQLAQKSLLKHVSAVADELAVKGLTAGQRSVARIVGRDVSQLDAAGVSRAAIESGAENFSDGVVAPVFWYLVLGLPGLFLYKLVNTADAMIGNRSERHEAFGWAAARFDDLLSFVPARLSVLLIAAPTALAGLDARAAVECALADASKHKSPNAGWPEAAVAGALGLALGGPRRYGDLDVDGAWLNKGGRRSAGPDDIRTAVRLIDAAWAFLLFAVALASVMSLVVAR